MDFTQGRDLDRGKPLFFLHWERVILSEASQLLIETSWIVEEANRLCGSRLFKLAREKPCIIGRIMSELGSYHEDDQCTADVCFGAVHFLYIDFEGHLFSCYPNHTHRNNHFTVDSVCILGEL
jgi:hypothetical protein